MQTFFCHYVSESQLTCKCLRWYLSHDSSRINLQQQRLKQCFSSSLSHLDQRLHRTNFLCIPTLCKCARFSHRTTGVYLSKRLLLQQYFYFETIIHLFWCTDSSRKGSMKQIFHQHSLYWQESGDELGLNLACFLLGCHKTVVCHFHFVLETLLSAGYTLISCPFLLCYVGPVVSHS